MFSLGDDFNRPWLELWQRLGAAGDGVVVYDDLTQRYSEPGRHYHTIDHIHHCLLQLEDGVDPAANLDALEFAIWFHDAVYDTRAHDNEKRSAALACEVARSAGLSEAFGDMIADLILATCHTALPDSRNAQVMVDIDLAILGAEPSSFDTYERQIRKEYAWVPDEAFAKGRVGILTSFLARPSIYSTEPFRTNYEQQAKENLRRSIAALRVKS